MCVCRSCDSSISRSRVIPVSPIETRSRAFWKTPLPPRSSSRRSSRPDTSLQLYTKNSTRISFIDAGIRRASPSGARRRAWSPDSSIDRDFVLIEKATIDTRTHPHTQSYDPLVQDSNMNSPHRWTLRARDAARSRTGPGLGRHVEVQVVHLLRARPLGDQQSLRSKRFVRVARSQSRVREI